VVNPPSLRPLNNLLNLACANTGGKCDEEERSQFVSGYGLIHRFYFIFNDLTPLYNLNAMPLVAVRALDF